MDDEQFCLLARDKKEYYLFALEESQASLLARFQSKQDSMFLKYDQNKDEICIFDYGAEAIRITSFKLEGLDEEIEMNQSHVNQLASSG